MLLIVLNTSCLHLRVLLCRIRVLGSFSIRSFHSSLTTVSYLSPFLLSLCFSTSSPFFHASNHPARHLAVTSPHFPTASTTAEFRFDLILINLPATTPQLPPTPVPVYVIFSESFIDLANNDQTSLRAFIAPIITRLAPSCIELAYPNSPFPEPVVRL